MSGVSGGNPANFAVEVYSINLAGPRQAPPGRRPERRIWITCKLLPKRNSSLSGSKDFLQERHNGTFSQLYF